MSMEVTGSNPSDGGPAGVVARFLISADARDEAASLEELHPDSRAQAAGEMSPPPMQSAHIGEPVAADDHVRVPVGFVTERGDPQDFVFVVRPGETASGWGIDLQATMEATFGGDPAQMMMDAMQQAFEPMGEAMTGIAGALGEAFSSGGQAPTPARRLALDEPLPEVEAVALDSLEFEIVRMEFGRTLVRAFQEDGSSLETSLSIRCQYALPDEIVARACLGVTLDRVESTTGEDLTPEYADDSLGRETYASWEQERREWYLTIRLRAPGAEFVGIGALSGRIRIDLSGGELMEVELGTIGARVGNTIHVAALDVPIRCHRDDDQQVVVQTTYGAFDGMELMFLDGGGNEIGTGYSGHGDGEISVRSYDSSLPDDATMRIRFSAQSGTIEVPFTTRGLPVTWA